MCNTTNLEMHQHGPMLEMMLQWTRVTLKSTNDGLLKVILALTHSYIFKIRFAIMTQTNKNSIPQNLVLDLLAPTWHDVAVGADVQL